MKSYNNKETNVCEEVMVKKSRGKAVVGGFLRNGASSSHSKSASTKGIDKRNK